MIDYEVFILTHNIISKKTNILSPTWTVVLAIVTLLGMYLALPQGNSNFYITTFCMILSSMGVVGAAIATSGIKGYGYPKRVTLQVVAWRYFLTQFIISAVFTLAPLAIGWRFNIEMKRYLIMHLAILALFGTAAILLVTGKRKMDEAKMADFHNWCVHIHDLRERVRALIVDKEHRVCVVCELDEMYTALSCAHPIYSESLAYIESEIKREFVSLDECVNNLTHGNEQDINLFADICKNIKKYIQEREDIIQAEIAQMENEE